jgi:hypothetical protein
MKRFFIIALIALSMLMSGCITRYNINKRYEYEGVYTSKTDIYIGTNKLDRSKDKERIWILSDKTLTYLLQEAKESIK